MMKKTRYPIFLVLLAGIACTSIHQERVRKSSDFRTVPSELIGVDWNRTPRDVLTNPIRNEPLIWVGVVRDVVVQEKDGEIEIEWLCEHLMFYEPGPSAISVRPIKTRKGEDLFVLSLIIKDMSIDRAKKFQRDHTAKPHYMLAGGKLAGFVERQGRRVPFLYTYRFGLGPDLAIIEK